VIFKGKELATVERRQALIDVELHPCLIVGRASLALREFGDAFGNELPRRRLDRSKIAALRAMLLDREEV
jgi:hypothetical protein